MADLLTWNGERGIRGGVTLARVRMSHLDPGSPQWEWTCVVGDCVWRGALSEADGQAKAEDAVRDWFERIGVVATDQVEWRALRHGDQIGGPTTNEAYARTVWCRPMLSPGTPRATLQRRAVGSWVTEPLDEEVSGG